MCRIRSLGFRDGVRHEPSLTEGSRNRRLFTGAAGVLLSDEGTGATGSTVGLLVARADDDKVLFVVLFSVLENK